MTRNRVLFDILAFFLGIAAFVAYLFIAQENISTLLSLLMVVFSGFVMGFVAFRRDGIKIALFTGLGIFIMGVATAALMIVGVFESLASAEGLDQLGIAIAGPIFIVAAIILFILSLVTGGLLSLGALIGANIGKNVWKDQPDMKYQNYAPPNQAIGIICQNCNWKNPPDNRFCKNCGVKIQ